MTNEPRDEDAPLEAAPSGEAAPVPAAAPEPTGEAPEPATHAAPEPAPADLESAEPRAPGPARPEPRTAEPPESEPRTPGPPETDPPEQTPVLTTPGAPPIVPAGEPRERRPWLERLGLGLIALVIGTLFGAVALAAWTGGEPFLGIMGGLGCLMTLWVGVLTIVRG